MGIFQQFPYTNFHEMNLDMILNNMKSLNSEWENFINEWESTIKEKIEQYLQSNPGWVTPELYGAVGDGIHDDSDAINNAIASNNVVFFPKKTYYVANTINVDAGKCIIGNYATLTGIADPIIKVQTYTDAGNQQHTSLPIIIEKFNITGDNGNTLIKIEKATKVKIADMNLRKFLNGIVFDGGYENIFTNCRFMGSVENAYSTGINILSGGDSVFEHLMGMDVVTAVKIQAGHNNFTDIHFWIHDPTLYQNSIMIYDSVPGGPTNIFNDVYFDTYQTCYYKTGLSSAIFNDPRCLCHEAVAVTDDCTLFIINNSDFVQNYSNLVRFNRVITSRGNTTRCIHACNNTQMPVYMTFMPTNSVQRDRFLECNLVKDLDIRRLARSECITLNSGYTITSGFLYKKDNHIFGTLTIMADNPLPVDSPQTIGTLVFKPSVPINTYCCTGITEWNSNHMAYLYLTENIVVKAYNNDTCIKMNIDYIME